MIKLAIIITHPIQYYLPLFMQLAKNCKLKVFYTWGVGGAAAKFDPDFKQVISWDLPLLEGYDYELLDNTAKDPGSHHFSGIANPTLIKKIVDFNPAAILVYGWAYHSHLQIIRYFKGKIPLWFRGDSTLLNEQSGVKQLLRSLFLKWVYQHIDRAFYVGTANRAYFKKFGLKESQLTFAPHAVDNDRFSASRITEALALRASLQISSEQILVVFAGKLEANKNLGLLLQSFLELNKENTHLLFVGNGELEGELRRKRDASTTLSMTNVHFMDFQNQTAMPVIYQACDLFCLPSQSETWGLAVNEAMASGKAVLISDRCGCANDLVKDGENGYIFEHNNIKDLNTKLRLLVSSKSKLKDMGQLSASVIVDWSIAKQCNVILNELKNQ